MTARLELLEAFARRSPEECQSALLVRLAHLALTCGEEGLATRLADESGPRLLILPPVKHVNLASGLVDLGRVRERVDGPGAGAVCFSGALGLQADDGRVATDVLRALVDLEPGPARSTNVDRAVERLLRLKAVRMAFAVDRAAPYLSQLGQATRVLPWVRSLAANCPGLFAETLRAQLALDPEFPRATDLQLLEQRAVQTVPPADLEAGLVPLVTAMNRVEGGAQLLLEWAIKAGLPRHWAGRWLRTAALHVAAQREESGWGSTLTSTMLGLEPTIMEHRALLRELLALVGPLQGAAAVFEWVQLLLSRATDSDDGGEANEILLLALATAVRADDTCMIETVISSGVRATSKHLTQRGHTERDEVCLDFLTEAGRTSAMLGGDNWQRFAARAGPLLARYRPLLPYWRSYSLAGLAAVALRLEDHSRGLLWAEAAIDSIGQLSSQDAIDLMPLLLDAAISENSFASLLDALALRLRAREGEWPTVTDALLDALARRAASSASRESQLLPAQLGNVPPRRPPTDGPME